MSIERNREEREHRERLAAAWWRVEEISTRLEEISRQLDDRSNEIPSLLASVNRSLSSIRRGILGMVALLAVALVLLALPLLKACPETPVPTSIPTRTPQDTKTPSPAAARTALTPATTPTPAWRAHSTCFFTNVSFERGSSSTCDPTPGPTVAEPAPRESSTPCPWNFRTADATRVALRQFLEAQVPGSFGVIGVFAGHDPMPIGKHHRELDSNFDLAHRRAVEVAHDVTAKLGDPTRWAVVPVAGSYPPPACEVTQTPGPTRQRTNTPTNEERRRPAVRVTIWSPE